MAGSLDAASATNAQPLTHTLGYVLRGIVEAYRFSKEDSLLRTACRTADGLLGAIRQDGYLPGRLDADWRARYGGFASREACRLRTVSSCSTRRPRTPATGLGGGAQSLCPSQDANRRAAGNPRRDQGIMAGDGEYCPLQYPNWACKFFIDSHLVELDVCREGQPGFQAGSGRMAVS